MFLALRDGADEDLDAVVADCETEIGKVVHRDYSVLRCMPSDSARCMNSVSAA
jgi:hypothetical protein